MESSQKPKRKANLIMSNKKIIIDPSLWILNPDNYISFRYRILTDDFNIRSAHSIPYSIEAPPLISSEGGEGIFTDVEYIANTETSNGSTAIRLSWTTTPQYDNMNYFIFIDNTYIQSVPFPSFTYVVPESLVPESTSYNFKVTIPNTTKTPQENTLLFETTVLV